MKALSERELRELLTMKDTIAAPADLAERIKAEIPDDLSRWPDTAPPRRSALTAGRWLALAASLLAMVGGSFLAFRMLRQPELTTTAVTAEHRAAGLESTAEKQQATKIRQDSARPGPEAGDAATAPQAPASAERRARSSTAGAEAPKASVREVAAELEALGYVGGPAADVPQRPKSPPAAENLATTRRVEMPKPRLAEGETFRGGSPRVESDASRPFDRDRAGADGKRLAPASPPPPRAFYEEIIVETEAIEPEAAFSLSAPMVGAEVGRAPSSTAVAPPSTGGTAEPNDAPYGDVFFRGYGTNPFIDTEDDALSTFGLDVDTGSYTVVRRFLRDGHLPPPDAVRVEELINYFDYGDPPPEAGDFAIHAEGAPSIFAQGERYHLVRFNLHGREIDDRDRRPAVLTFVVDVSGSMAREDRLGLVKQALALLLGELRADDRVALVVYGTRGRVVLEPTGDRGEIRRAIDRLVPEGSTNAEEGLRLAYELAARERRRGAVNRVILCSDGVANVGRTSAESILGEIRRHASQGIELTTVGFGMGNYNDVLMERLADTGNGRYAYVDSLDEARRIFVENLTGTLQTIAAEARVQVEWNPETVARYRLLGYENRDIADERFRDDTVDAGEIGAGHTVTALYEVKLHKKLRRNHEIATLHLRWGSIAAGEMVEIARPVTVADFAPRWEKASPALRLTSLVAEFAEILKGTYWAREGDLDDVFRRAQKVSAEFAGDREVADFVSLVGRAADHRREED